MRRARSRGCCQKSIRALWSDSRYAFLSCIISTAAGVVGCGPDESTSGRLPTTEAVFSSFDSAGVTVSVTDGTAADSPIGWVVDSLPDLEIGSAGPTGDLFRVGGVRGRAGDGVVVVDGGSRELRFFDSAGGLLGRVGRRGEGPGEFLRPELIQAFGTDSLLLWDWDLQRFQLFSGDGQTNRTIRLRERWPAGGRPPLGAVGLNMLVEDFQAEWLVPAASQREGAKEDVYAYLWVNPDSGVEIPIARIKTVRTYISVRNGRPASMSQIPFAFRPSGTVANGTAVLDEGPSPEIREYGVDGRLQRVLRIDQEPRPVTEEILQTYLEFNVEPPYRGEAAERYEKMPIPDLLPYFQSLQVDEMGWIWAQKFQLNADLPIEWVVFDPEGRARGTIQTPEGFQVERIGPDFILGVWLDEYDVEYVRRHRLRRAVEGA